MKAVKADKLVPGQVISLDKYVYRRIDKHALFEKIDGSICELSLKESADFIYVGPFQFESQYAAHIRSSVLVHAGTGVVVTVNNVFLENQGTMVEQ